MSGSILRAEESEVTDLMVVRWPVCCSGLRGYHLELYSFVINKF